MHDIDFNPKGTPSFLHRLDPRIKLVCAFLGIVGIVMSGLYVVVASLFILLLLLRLSKAPCRTIVKHLVYPLFIASIVAGIHPFTYGSSVVFEFHVKIYREGLFMAALIFTRILASVLVLNLLILTTSLAEIIRGMRQLRIPKIVFVVALLMLRFIPVIAEEGSTIYRARWSRLGYSGGYIAKMREYGALGGALVLRSLSRSFEVFKSMWSRGYEIGGD
jgi:cobalt ECF transporter T component CbiQ